MKSFIFHDRVACKANKFIRFSCRSSLWVGALKNTDVVTIVKYSHILGFSIFVIKL